MQMENGILTHVKGRVKHAWNIITVFIRLLHLQEDNDCVWWGYYGLFFEVPDMLVHPPNRYELCTENLYSL